jgi:60S ribosome subunit biogenesis protein NIP7
MRPLSDDETRIVFEKLAKYIGGKLKYLIETEEKTYVFRLHRNRVYYCDEEVLKLSAHFERKRLISVGTCIGKFTKSSKFRILITALDYLGKYAKNKVWLKPNGEQSFLYGNHILKTNVARITDDTQQYSGMIVCNLNDVPLGFATSARSSVQIKDLEPTGIVGFNQGDLGEYLRVEDDN